MTALDPRICSVEFRVRFDEAGPDGLLRTSSLLRYAQDLASYGKDRPDELGAGAIVPLVRDTLMPFFQDHFPFFPFKSENYTGFSALSGGIVLAVMVAPLIIAITQEVIRTVPIEVREASLAVGATRWETVKHAVLRKARMGIVAAVILGLSRAFGETIAVLMVSGCAMHAFPTSVFDPAYPLPALIANTNGEMMSVPMYDAAVLLAAFLLFAVTTFFNMAGWSILLRMERGEQ